MQETNNMNMEDVVVEGTDGVVTTSKSGGVFTTILTIAGVGLLVFGIAKGAKFVKTKIEEGIAKQKAKKAAKKETFHSEIFDEEVEVSEDEEISE